jgi:type III pantothenate kinase
MFIAIDIGNTTTEIGVYNKDTLIAAKHLTSTSQISNDLIEQQLHALLYGADLNKQQIKNIGISSVVPDLTKVYSAMMQNYFGIEPFIVRADLDLGIKIHYDGPNSLGADRICNAIAGHIKYGGPLIIIDLGTATTYDVVASNGDFLGGVIAPGIATSSANLYNRTAQLPKVDLILPGKIICTDTISAIQTGILYGAIDSIAGMIQRIKMELRSLESKDAIVIATGGFSKFIKLHSNSIQHLEPSLVLDGIRLIFERLNSGSK